MVNYAKYGSASMFAAYAAKEHHFAHLDEATQKRAGEILEELIDNMFEGLPIREFVGTEHALSTSVYTINRIAGDGQFQNLLIKEGFTPHQMADFIQFFIVFDFDKETLVEDEAGDMVHEYSHMIEKFKEFLHKFQGVSFGAVMARITEEQK